MASLEVLKGPNVGEVYELSPGESVIGRYPFCEVMLPSHTISRQHARIVYAEGRYRLDDLGSLNGTFVNGDRVRKRTVLKDQDRIRIYEVLLLFRDPATAMQQTVEHQPAPPESKAKETMPLEADASPEQPGEEFPLPKPLAAAKVFAAPDRRAGVSPEQLLLVLRAIFDASSPHNLSEALLRVLDAALEVFPGVESGQVLMDGGSEVGLEIKASKHRQDDTITSMTMAPTSQSMARHVLARAEAIVCASASDDDEDSVLGDVPRTMMAAPMIGASREIVGVLHLEAKGLENALSADHLPLLISLGYVAGQAAQYALLCGETSPGQDDSAE